MFGMRLHISCCLITVAIAVLFVGCKPSVPSAGDPSKELLIYCGITMIKPMTEIARHIEALENCKIIITKDGSGNLLKAIRINRVGDLFLPGSGAYIETGLNEGLVTESVHVGYNRAALMVQKGNPRKIAPNLLSLAGKDYYVAVGNPTSGSIGKETQKILEKRGIFDQVMTNARRLTTDSKKLVHLLKEKQADLVINWYATATWPENRPYVDVLPIDPVYATPKKLVLGLLSTAKYPNIARKFMAFAASEQGRAIFQKNGLYDVE